MRYCQVCRKQLADTPKYHYQCTNCYFDRFNREDRIKYSNATVTEFSDWTFMRTKGKVRRPSAEWEEVEQTKSQGVFDHAEIERIKLKIKNLLPSNEVQYFEVEFSESDKSDFIYFGIPSLKIGSRDFRGRPDLVLKHKHTDHRIIIERKTTRRMRYIDQELEQYEHNNWMNIQCQLWCYSRIQDWSDSNDILLVGELWRRLANGMLVQVPEPLYWRKGEGDHESTCETLFRQFGGVIV